MTLLAHDEADVIGDHVAYHLAAGVDFVVATDHRSSDGTTEILRSFEVDGRLRLIREDDEPVRQREWVTRMARLAASEHGADWVINSDADEFWWPRAGSLSEQLAAVPADVGAVRAVVRPFLPRAGDTWFAERMTARLTLSAPLNDPATAFRHVAKVAHRAHPDIVVEQGNHVVSRLPFARLDAWFPLELFHFPLRSRRQLERRLRSAWPGSLRSDIARARLAGLSYLDRLAVGDDAVRRGVEEGWIVEDVRLRDALRALSRGAAEKSTGRGADWLRVAGPSAVRDVSRAVEGACLLEADVVRLQRRADELRERVRRVEARRARVYGVVR